MIVVLECFNLFDGIAGAPNKSPVTPPPPSPPIGGPDEAYWLTGFKLIDS